MIGRVTGRERGVEGGTCRGARVGIGMEVEGGVVIGRVTEVLGVGAGTGVVMGLGIEPLVAADGRVSAAERGRGRARGGGRGRGRACLTVQCCKLDRIGSMGGTKTCSGI